MTARGRGAADMPTLVVQIMEAWRHAERLVTALPEGSPERAAVEAVSAQLRASLAGLTANGIAPKLSAGEGRLLLADARRGPDRDARPHAVAESHLEETRTVERTARDAAEDAAIADAEAESIAESHEREPRRRPGRERR